jgi:hypothetical protein
MCNATISASLKKVGVAIIWTSGQKLTVVEEEGVGWT